MRRHKRWGVARERADRTGIFFVLKFCFLLSKKTRKARKSSQFGTPNSTILDEIQGLRFPFPPRFRASEDGAGRHRRPISQGCCKHKKPRRSILHKLGVMPVGWIMCNFYPILMHPFFWMKTQIRS